MASIGDIYQMRVNFQLTQGQEALAVMFYEVVAGGSGLTAGNVADEFDTNVLPDVQAALCDDYGINRIFTINGMDNDDFNDTNPTRTGTLAGSPNAGFMAVGIRGPFPGPGFHRARHNLPLGVTISLGAHGLWLSAAKTTFLTAAQGFGQLLEHSNGSLSPVTIQGGFVLGVPPVRRAYAQGVWEVNDYATTQKSRQTYNWSAP